MRGSGNIRATTTTYPGPDVDDPIAVVVITTFDLDSTSTMRLRASAKGFLLKDAEPVARAGDAPLPASDALIAPSITARLLETFAGTRSGQLRHRSGLEPP